MKIFIKPPSYILIRFKVSELSYLKGCLESKPSQTKQNILSVKIILKENFKQHVVGVFKLIFPKFI